MARYEDAALESLDNKIRVMVETQDVKGLASLVAEQQLVIINKQGMLDNVKKVMFDVMPKDRVRNIMSLALSQYMFESHHIAQFTGADTDIPEDFREKWKNVKRKREEINRFVDTWNQEV